MDIINLEKFLKDMGESGYRLKQIKKAVFVDLIKDWEEATTLSKKLREEIKKEFNILSWEVLNIIESKNKDSVKAIFKLKDGNIIETVLMKHLNTKEDDTKNGRNTVCVSSQAGCAINCEFCATGKMGLKRNLTGEEIIDQVLFFARHLRQWQGETLTLDVKVSPCHDRYEKVNNVVFMGMGEPFLNYDNTIQAIRILNDKDGFNLGIRHISVSTCGIIPGIEKFAEENLQVNLAISLHAADDETRTKLMPINKTYPLAELMKNSLYHVNLIKYHDTGLARNASNLACEAGRADFKPSLQAKRTQFFDTLKKLGVSVTFRVSFGEDILAACGQLAGRIQ